MDGHQSKQVVAGLILIAVGLVFLGNRFDVLPVVDLHRIWPVFVILAGLVRVSVRRPEGGRSGFGLVLVGIIFLLHTYRVWSIQQSWPLFIVAAGITMLAEQIGRNRQPAATGDSGQGKEESGR